RRRQRFRQERADVHRWVGDEPASRPDTAERRARVPRVEDERVGGRAQEPAGQKRLGAAWKDVANVDDPAWAPRAGERGDQPGTTRAGVDHVRTDLARKRAEPQARPREA